MSRLDERAEVYERLAVAVAEQLAADGRLRAVLEAAVERVAEREWALELLTPAEVAAWFRVPVKAVGALAREGSLNRAADSQIQLTLGTRLSEDALD